MANMRLEDLPERYQTQARRQLNAPRLASLLVKKVGCVEKGAKKPIGTLGGKGGSLTEKPKRNACKGGKRAKSDIVTCIRGVVCDFSFYSGKTTLKIDVDPSKIPTAQQKGAGIRGGKLHFFTKKKVAAWEKALVSALKPLASKFDQYRRAAHENGIAIDMEFAFRYPVQTPNRVLLLGSSAMVKRPDVDNLCKGVMDCLTMSGILDDDNCVSTLHLRKCRETCEPYIMVSIAKDTWMSAC